MAVAPDPNIYLHELSDSVFQTLVQKLRRQDAWRRLAASCSPIVDEQCIEQRKCPATAILNELDDKSCTVCNLRELLLHAELQEAAAVLSEPQCLSIGVESIDDDDMFVHCHGELHLEVAASGVPLPQFLWFCDNEELPNQRNSVLIITDFGPQHEGEYKCLVSQECSNHDHNQFSTPTNVRMTPEMPRIQEQPIPVTVRVGEDVILSCRATSYPPPRYEWIRDNTVLVSENNCILKISGATTADNGLYKCSISNGFNETVTEAVKVFVYESPIKISTVSKSELPIVTEKVALLIANAEYATLCHLHTPYNDVKALGDILQSLGFKVVSLCDLTQVEMINAVRVFCDLIPEGAYAFFYFAGHGFELHDKYMLPVECPTADKYLRSDSVNERHIIKEVLAKNPRLFLLMLDMCLKIPNREENPAMYAEQVPPIPYGSQRNLIQAYATSSNCGAYERMTEENGIYMKHLLNFLANDMPIVEILNRVIQSFSKEGADAVDLQMPSITTNVVPDRHYLTLPSRENHETKELFEKMTDLKKSLDVHFVKVNRCAHLKFGFFRNCFLNAMDIHLYNLHDWNIACEIQSRDLEMSLGIIDGIKVLTIRHLQKLKNPKIDMVIKLSDANGTLVDHAMLEICSIPIGCCSLWFDHSTGEVESVDFSELSLQ